MADLREQVKDIMRPAIMNDVTPLPSDVDITAEAAIKVIRERIEALPTFTQRGSAGWIHKREVLKVFDD